MNTEEEFSLIIRQQPTKGRRCGFSVNISGNLLYPYFSIEIACQRQLSPEEMENCTSQFICTVSLYSSDRENDLSIIIGKSNPWTRKREQKYYKTLIGKIVDSPRILRDPVDGIQKLFFVFPDLSVRVQGEYTLQATMINIQKYLILTSPFYRSVAFTEPFMVYPPREFPGIDDPTPLTRSFAIQGIKNCGRRFSSLNQQPMTKQSVGRLRVK